MLCLFDEDEIVYNAHQIAWFSRDWVAVQKLADEYKEKPENEFFAILNNINSAKQELNVSVMDGYSKFAIDNTLSKHTDCLHAAFTANLFMQGLSDQAHHNYMMNAVPQGRRFAKGSKLSEPYKDKFVIELLAKWYKVNRGRAVEYLSLIHI